MTIKSVQKAKPTDQPQVQLSGVKDGEVYNYMRLTQLIQQAASVQPGESQTLTLEPVQPEGAQ